MSSESHRKAGREYMRRQYRKKYQAEQLERVGRMVDAVQSMERDKAIQHVQNEYRVKMMTRVK